MYSTGPRHRMRRQRRRRPSPLLLLTAFVALAGATALVYSSAASWVFALNQTQVVERYDTSINTAQPSAAEQLDEARRYNADLSAGAILAANANVPEGAGVSRNDLYDYWSMLSTPTGVMARIQIPRIDVDLPIYHGTSENTLQRGIGHLEGTSLPVGGDGSHTVLTGHRGLAEARLFSDLDQLEIGDTFTVNTFGEVFTYQVVDTQVVEPDDTQALRQDEGRDLVTLVTCTPLGVNTHRILVTGERVTPTPDKDVESATGPAEAPGFPWWLVAYVIALVGISWYVWWGGRRSSKGGRDRSSSRGTAASGATPAAPVHSGEDEGGPR